MYRARARIEDPSRRSSARGSVGSARVWDEHTRARRLAGDGEVANGSGAAGDPAPPQAGLQALIETLVQIALEARAWADPSVDRHELARSVEARLRSALEGPYGSPETPGLPEAPANGHSNGSTNGRANGSAHGSNGSTNGFANGAANGNSASLLAGLPAAARALGLVLDDRLSRVGGPLTHRPDVRERLIALVLTTLDTADEATLASREELSSLDQLQRRQAKLERSLEETRAALEYVSGLEHLDTGIASIY